MANVLVFTPRHKHELQKNYDDFINFSKNKLILFDTDESNGKKTWECNKWSWNTRRGSKLTIVHGISESRSLITPYVVPYADFAKAYVRYEMSLNYKDSVGWASSIPWIYRALSEQAELRAQSAVDIMDINNIAINRIAELLRASSLSLGGKRNIALSLEKVLAFIKKMRFKVDIQDWSNPFPRPSDTTTRFDQNSRKKELEKCPSDYQMLQVADAFHSAKTPRQKYYSSLCVMLMCQPSRSIELKGLTIHSLQRTDKGRWYLIWHPAKGGDSIRKWIPKLLEDVVQQAFERLIEISKPARVAVKFAYENPGEFMLNNECVTSQQNDDNSPLTYSQFAQAMGLKVGYSESKATKKINWTHHPTTKWLNNLINDLNGVSNWRKLIPSNCHLNDNNEVVKRVKSKFNNKLYVKSIPIFIRFPSYKDCVKVIDQQYKNDEFPYYGSIPLWESICLIRDNEFHKDFKIKPFSWLPVTHSMMASAIGDRRCVLMQSIFDELNITDEDGLPLNLTTHQFRHWLNTKLKLAGEEDWLIAKWSGRADIQQNKAYDGRTPEQRSRLTNMIRHVGNKDKVMTVAQVSQTLALFTAETPPPSAVLHDLSLPISLKSLGVERYGVAQFTGLGYCVHNYAESPCTKSGDCVTCNEHVCLKGIPNTLDELKSLDGLLEEQLMHAKGSAVDNVYGADRWVSSLGFKLAKLKTIIRLLEDPKNADGLPVRVSDNLEPSSVKRSLNITELDVIPTFDLTSLALNKLEE